MKDGDVAHGLQLWVNLPRAEKMCEPRYQELPAAAIPQVSEGGVTAHVIAGTALGTTSPVYTRNPVEYIHYFLQPHTTLNHRVAKGFNSFLYTLQGKISVGTPDSAKLIGAHNTVTLTNDSDADGVTITTFDQAAELVLLAGKPINEPVVQHGPFVMSTREEIMEAIKDYQLGRNGFERAPGWRSDIGRPITDHM